MSDETPRVAIGMPVYNGAHILEGAVRSLLAQSEADFLLHIADDGSTDGSISICEELAREDARITVVRRARNTGMTANFRSLLDAADSPFFMWAAQDDRWDPDFLREGLRALDGNPEAIGYMPAIAFEDGDGTPIEISTPPDGLSDTDPAVRARAVRQGGFHAIYALYRRQALDGAVALEDVSGTDIAFVFGLALRGPFVLDRTVRAFRQLVGYRLVTDARGRPVTEKALGASGHLYARNPNAMCGSWSATRSRHRCRSRASCRSWPTS